MAWLRRTVTRYCRLGLVPHQMVARLATANATTDGEMKIARLLTEKLNPTYLEVRDVSGGCGSMYEIMIDSEQFSGKRLVQQHRLVTDALGPVVKTLHGLTIKTGNPVSK